MLFFILTVTNIMTVCNLGIKFDKSNLSGICDSANFWTVYYWPGSGVLDLGVREGNTFPAGFK
jgi:hypothetical protein